MPNLVSTFPDAKTLLAIEPEELGDVMLELLHQGMTLNRERFSIIEILSPVENIATSIWPVSARSQVQLAVAKAVAWLQHQLLVVVDPSQPLSTGWLTMTRRGQELRTREQAAAYRQATILPVGLAHPKVLEKSYSAFLRGDHDIAVFSAVKAVEVVVREAGGVAEGELGLNLMRKVFHPETGPLTDKDAVFAEREATQNLFVGAIGAGKNPTSHRNVEMRKVEAARLIIFASYLMSLVDPSPS